MELPTLLLLLLASQAPAPDGAPHRSPTPPSTAALTAGGRVWTYRVGSLLPLIALGDRGGQVLALVDDELLLLSSFDANPPAPAWRAPDASPAYDYPWLAASANGDVYLRPDYRDTPTTSEHDTLEMYRSGSSLPEWRYSFFPPQLMPNLSGDVSRDGETIVSLFDDWWTMEMELRVHDPATGAATRTIVYPYILDPDFLVDLSPEGSVAACSAGNLSGRSSVFDLETGELLDTVEGIFLGHQALSENGRVFATHQFRYPDSSLFRVFRRVPSGYALAFDVPEAAELWSWDLAVSDDGSTVVVRWVEAGTPSLSIVRAYDVATATMTMEHAEVVQDGYVFPTEVAISADGSVFVVGLWGDGSGAVSELAVYSRDSSQPIREHPDSGSVYDVEMSPDGKRYAAVRSLDNPPYYSPAVIELYELGGEDLVVRGRPSVGETITFELHGAPGARAALLRSLALARNPIDVPGVGTLHLDPATLSSTSMGVVPPSGVAILSTNADTIPSMIGRTLWFQGLTSRPRHLTTDFVQLTILP